MFEVRDLWPEAPIQMGALRNPLARRLARALERLVYRRSARVIALSPGIRDGVAAAGVPPERIELVPNASDLELFAPVLDRPALRAELGLGPELGFVCSYFGTLGEANDLSQVVRAAPLLDGVTFVLLGDGKQREALEREAQRSRGGERALPATRPRQAERGQACRGVGRVPHDLQGRARALHLLSEQALRHLRRGPAGHREPARLDARAGRAQRGRPLRSPR